MTGLADNYSVSGSGGAVINHGLYTDTVWAVPVTFKDTAGQAINLAGQPYVAEIVSGSTVIFRFRSSGAAANEGTLGLANAATGVIMFNASIAQHAGVAAGLYRVHLKRDLAEDVWTSEGTILIGKPGAKETYLLFDAPGVESAGALSYAQQAAAAAATAVGAAAAASTDADDAAASATAAASSESAVAASAAAAASSQSAAAASQSAAAGSATAAASSASAAASSEAAADVSEAAASTSATAAAGSATASQNARLASEAARDASVTAKTASESARDAAVVAKTAAETAETNAETAEVAAEAAQAAAESARNAAQTSATQASTSKDAAAASATSAASSATAASADRVAAQTARSGAEAARDAASASAQTATTKAGEALSSANNAAASAAASEASKNAAATSASNIETSYGALGNILDKSAEATAAATVAVSSAQSANLSQLSAAQSALVAAQYSVASGLDTATRNAQAAASLAQGYAASAASVVQQDLSGITAQALHRSPNAITAMVIYDTSKDSDGGAWTEKCQHTSWYNEALSGKWLGAQESEFQARYSGATLGSELVTNPDFNTSDISLWSGTGATLSVVSGQLQLVPSTTFGAAFSSAITTVVGTTYALTVKVSTPSAWAAQVGTSVGGGQLGNISFNTIGTYTKYFTATTTTTYLRFGCGGVQATLLLDSISFRPVTAFNTASGDYFQLTTDGKFYRLWKNILSHTDAMDNAAWAKTNGTVTVNAATNPLSGLGAEAFIEATDTNLQHSVSLAGFFPLTGTYTLSVALKANGRDWAALNLTTVVGVMATTDPRAWFNLATGTVGSVPTVTGANVTAKMTALGSGWYRCSISFTYSSLANRRPIVLTSTADGSVAHNGDGVSGILIGGFQLEQSATETAYEPKAAEGSISEVFRGNKADFPRLAAIVAEAGNVSIYDLTEPGRPMWMRFFGGNSSCVVRGNNLTCITSFGGFLYIGHGTSFGLAKVDFVNDKATLITTSGEFLPRNISNRNDTSFVFSTATNTAQGPSVVNAAINAVAMTVLPDAPIDPATGLRVPTIAVATGGGVSVIKHNGTVVGSANTNSFFFVYIDKNVLMYSRTGDRWVAYALNPGSLGAGFSHTLMGANPDQYQNVNPTVERFFSRNSMGRFASPLVSRKINNEANPSRGLNAAIASTFNTGWLPGDIRRAYLADADVGTVTGTELVSNGTFNSDITGWTQLQGIIEWDASGKLSCRGDLSSNSTAQQTITTVVGKTYRVSYTVDSSAQVFFGTNSNGLQYYFVNVAAGTYTTVFTATATSIFLQFRGTSNKVMFDNISLVEVVLDRSYKAAFAPISGTLTKAQLATGTSLVGYSGFSAANYLREPYSADLDFGTGEWSCSAWVNVPATLTDAMFPLGPEMVVNGSLDSSTGWSLDPGWSISGGVAASNAASGYNSVAQWVAVAVGRYYRASVDVVSRSAGQASLYVGTSGGAGIGSGGSTLVGTLTAQGVFPSGANTVIAVRQENGFVGSVDNFSLKEVLPTWIADRSHSTGPRIRLGINRGGRIVAEAFEGVTTQYAYTTAAYNTATWLKAEACYTTDGTLSIRVNGREVATSRGNPLLSLSSRYNLLTYSEDMSNAAWGGTGSTRTADTLTVTVNNNHSVWAPLSGVVTTGGTFTSSCEVKAGTASFVTVEVWNGGSQNGARLWFNLQNGTAGQSSATAGFTVISTGVTSMGDGWYRIWVSGAVPAGTIYFAARATDSDGSYLFTAVNGKTFLLRKAQLQAGPLMPYQRVGAATDFDFQAPLTIGNNFAADAPFPGSIALLKLGATVPTPEQATFMYEQEKQLFRAGAQSVLPDSGSIVDMAYDDATDRWVAISATNESYWTGLVRNSVTPVPAGSYTRVVAGSGLELVARSTTNPGVDVTIPAYGLREELVKRAEAAARLTKEIVTYDYVGGFTANTTTGNTAITNVSTITYPASYIGARISGSGIPANTTIVAVSGTTIYLSAAATATATGVSISFLDFELPVGMEAKTILSAGALRREGSTQDYTRLYDGFIETIRFAVAPGATAWVQIQAQRITLQ